MENTLNDIKLEKVERLLEEYGEWKLHCTFLYEKENEKYKPWHLSYGTIIGTENGKVYISEHSLPCKRDMSCMLIQHNVKIEPKYIVEIYQPLE